MATEPEERLDPLLAEAIAGLSDREPETDLWVGIAGRIKPRRPGLLLSWPAAAAAAIALITTTALVTGSLMNPATVSVADTLPAVPPSGVQVVAADFSTAEASLEQGCQDLEEVFNRIAPDLEPEVRDAIQQSLAILDSAVIQAQVQSRSQPDDLQAARYLTQMLQRKLNVLRTVTSLTATRSST